MKFFTILFLVGVACAVGSSFPAETTVNSSLREEETIVRDSARISITASDATIAPDTTRKTSSYNFVKILKKYIEEVIRYLDGLMKFNWRKTQERQQRP